VGHTLVGDDEDGGAIRQYPADVAGGRAKMSGKAPQQTAQTPACKTNWETVDARGGVNHSIGNHAVDLLV